MANNNDNKKTLSAVSTPSTGSAEDGFDILDRQEAVPALPPPARQQLLTPQSTPQPVRTADQQFTSLSGVDTSAPLQQQTPSSGTGQPDSTTIRRGRHDHFHIHGHTSGGDPFGGNGGGTSGIPIGGGKPHVNTGDGGAGGGGGPGGSNKPAVECVPMTLDAFVLNKHIFTGEYYVAPLAVPDHSSFLPGIWSSPDAVPRVDIDASYPWYKNSRIADITEPTADGEQGARLKEERLGVYLQWCLPRRFRGTVTKDIATPEGEVKDGSAGEKQAGVSGSSTKTEPTPNPSSGDARDRTPGEDTKDPDVQHASVPDRWIIMRFVHEATAVEEEAPRAPALTAFIVESNRIRHLSKEYIADVATEAAPFIDRSLPVEKQDEVFLGIKRAFDDDWEDPEPEATYHSPLTLLDTANPLLADFQHQNANVFSIHDDLTWRCEGECAREDNCQVVFHAAAAKVSYAVFGYFSASGGNAVATRGQQKVIVHGSMFDVMWNRDKRPPKITAEAVSQQMRASQPVAVGGNTLEALETYLGCLPSKYKWADLLGQMRVAISQAGQGGGLLDSFKPEDSRSGFKPVDGGSRWRFNVDQQDDSEHGERGKPRQPHIPSIEEMQAMYLLDRHQAYADALERQERYLRHILFCEWWKRRSRVPGGLWSQPDLIRESDRTLREALASIKRVKELRELYKGGTRLDKFPGLQQTTRQPFYSRMSPAVVVGALGSAWPSEFADEKPTPGRDLRALPFRGIDGSGVVQEWLKTLVNTSSGSSSAEVCTIHGMRLFFSSAATMQNMRADLRDSPTLRRLPELFSKLDSLGALNWTAPGWVRNAVDTLMQEWVYTMNGQPMSKLPSPPRYSRPEEINWSDTQPWRALFVEWEVEYTHLPKRFWSLERNSDGTADYRISPDVNISSFDGLHLHQRTISGRSLLRPNAAWPVVTLLSQLLAKVSKERIASKASLGRAGEALEQQLKTALQVLQLSVCGLEDLPDHLLTLQRGVHIIPHRTETFPPTTDDERALLDVLLESDDGFDVTPYGEATFADPTAERDFRPVTHGQARFIRLNVVDKFGQVVSPMIAPDPGQKRKTTQRQRPDSLYPCISPSLACQRNEAEGGDFANSVSLDDGGASQYFQLGHRINQDARLNTYFAVNSADWQGHHETCQWYKGDRTDNNSKKHAWRPATEYEDPVWGWLVLNFRSRGIQIYNAAGESMGEALLPETIYGKVYWQVYYAEGDLGETDSQQSSQLREMMRKMSNPKFLFGLWTMLADACQNISHGSVSSNDQLSTLVGRPMALVNIGMALELATPVMRTHSYADSRKIPEIHLDEYKFEVLLGHKSNLHDGLVGYWPSSPQSTGANPLPVDAVTSKQPDPSTIYTHFGYPGRNIVDGTAKPDAFTSPTHSRIYISPYHVDPAEHPHDAPAYMRAVHNHASAVVLGAIIDPFQPVSIATGVLPPTSLRLAPWIVSRTLERLRMVFRGGPLLMRGDLEGIDDGADGASVWNRPPLNPVRREAPIPAITAEGAGGADWAWLQPLLPDEDEGGVTEDMPSFVPYAVKGEPAAQYPLPSGPHTVIEGFYKFGLDQMAAGGRLLPGKTWAGAGGEVDRLVAEADEARHRYRQAQIAS